MKRMLYYGITVAYLVSLYVMGLLNASIQSLIIVGLMAIITLLCLLLGELIDCKRKSNSDTSTASYLSAMGIIGSMLDLGAKQENKEKVAETK